MVLITLFSQLPIFNDRPILKNKISLSMGIICYLIIGIAIYIKIIPNEILQTVLNNRYIIIGLIAFDLILYTIMHRMIYGYLPFQNNTQNMIRYNQNLVGIEDKRMKMNQIENNNKEINREINKEINKERITHRVNEKKEVNPQSNKKSNGKRVYFEETSVNLDDDLESSLKKKGQTKISDYPEDVSLPGRNYFKDDESKAIIENFDIDEYTNDEYIN